MPSFPPACRPVRASRDSTDCVRRTAEGRLSSEQTSRGTVPRSHSGAAVQRGTDGQVPEPRDGRAACRRRRTVRTASRAAGAQHRRDTDERGGEQVVAVDVRCPTLHGLSRTADARSHRAGRTADRPVRGRGQLRPGQDVLEAEAVAMVLGSSGARLPEPDRHGTARREATGTRPAETDEAAAPRVASVSRSTPHPHWSETSAGPHARQDRTTAAARMSREDLGNLPRTAATPPLVVDAPLPRRCRTHQQRQRTRLASRRHLAQADLWNTESEGEPLRKDAANGDGNLPTANPQRLPVRHRSHDPTRHPTASTITPPRGVNGYEL